MKITQSLHRSVQIDPNRLMTVDGDRRITAKESFERVSKLAGALIAYGLSVDDRVAILAQNSDRYHEVLLAVPWAAGVVVPLNSRWSPDEVTFAL